MLPEPLRVLRSRLAQAIGLALRPLQPLLLRLGRFAHECSARAKLHGLIAPGVQFTGPIRVEGEALVDIGPGSRIGRGVTFETYNGARITLGAHVTINDGVTLCAYHGITIGADTMIGEFASIRDANHGTRAGMPISAQTHQGAPIHIGADCWLARGALVLRGVNMGDGAVAAAHAVVNKDVPPSTLVAGLPAHPIGERS